MLLNLNSLKKYLDRFAYECNLTVKEIGEIADSNSSISNFKNELDELCIKNVSKTSSEILAEFGMRFAESKTSTEPTPSENFPLQNEIIEVKQKIDKLNERDRKKHPQSKL